jgi:hypothetical protein
MNKHIIIRSATIIRLEFPYCTLKKYEISYTNALNSEYLANLLEGIELVDYNSKTFTDEDIQFVDFTIPLSAYLYLKETDLDSFMGMWNGTHCYYNVVNDRFNEKCVTSLAGFLLMSRNLKWVKYMEEKHPQYPPEIIDLGSE